MGTRPWNKASLQLGASGCCCYIEIRSKLVGVLPSQDFIGLACRSKDQQAHASGPTQSRNISIMNRHAPLTHFQSRSTAPAGELHLIGAPSGGSAPRLTSSTEYPDQESHHYRHMYRHDKLHEQLAYHINSWLGAGQGCVMRRDIHYAQGDFSTALRPFRLKTGMSALPNRPGHQHLASSFGALLSPRGEWRFVWMLKMLKYPTPDVFGQVSYRG